MNDDFARRILSKYGWEEGKGLGKHENGITEPIKPSMKFDTAGVGHDPGEQFTFRWWDHIYNSAAKNIIVENSKDGVNMQCVGDVEVSTKKSSTKSSKKLKKYGNFLWSGTLLNDGKLETATKSKDHDSEESNGDCSSRIADDEMFEKCGKRTAHKAARHGLILNGKLQRLEEQEKLLLAKLYKKHEVGASSVAGSSMETTKKDSLETSCRKRKRHKTKKKY